MQGRVKFHRKITEREWYSDANTFRVFFHLITIANHKDWKRQGIDVKRWQTITWRIELAKKLNLSEMQIRTALDKLERTGEISKKTTNRFTIITVLKYCDYNDHDQEDNQQITNKQPTDNQQITTNKNDKKEKNEKELKEISSKEDTAIAEYWNKEVNEIISILKEKVKESELIYSPDPQDRQYAKHLLSKKFSANLLQFWMTMEEFIGNIVKLSTQPYTKQVNNCKKFYYNRWDVINSSKSWMNKNKTTISHIW